MSIVTWKHFRTVCFEIWVTTSPANVTILWIICINQKSVKKWFSPKQKDADMQHQHAYVCAHMAVSIMCRCGQCVQCMHDQCVCVCVWAVSVVWQVWVCAVCVQPVRASTACMTSVCVQQMRDQSMCVHMFVSIMCVCVSVCVCECACPVCTCVQYVCVTNVCEQCISSKCVCLWYLNSLLGN